MSVLLEMIGRGWGNFLARPNGSLSLRFYVQPTMASLLALRAGIQDARQGRQGYLWAILTRPERRLQLLHEGWRGAMNSVPVGDCARLHLEAGAPTKTHILNLLHRLVDGRPTDTPTIKAPEALTLTTEPRADVERYDALRKVREARHAS